MPFIQRYYKVISVRDRVAIYVSAGFCLLLAMLLMCLPLQWVTAILIAGAIHEFFHIAAIYLLNGQVYRLSISLRGAVLETEQMHPSKELLCALAGPIGSALLLLLVRWFPRLAICGALHCIFNLLPLFPLDGGRVLRSVIYLLVHPQKNETVWRFSQILLRMILASVLVVAAVKLGWFALLLGIVLLKAVRREKLLANGPFWRYNKGSIGKGVQL